MEDDFDTGFLIGILVGEGSFGGDGRQPAILLRMHTRHEAVFHRLQKIVTGARLYGPYHHSGRSYFQLAIRGPALKRLIPTLDKYLTPSLDQHAYDRYTAMKQNYARPLANQPT